MTILNTWLSKSVISYLELILTLISSIEIDFYGVIENVSVSEEHMGELCPVTP